MQVSGSDLAISLGLVETVVNARVKVRVRQAVVMVKSPGN